jgi:hypothetical protein
MEPNAQELLCIAQISTALSSATSRRNRTSCKLQPHRLENFKFAPKVRDIVGLYTNPRDKAIVLSVD